MTAPVLSPAAPAPLLARGQSPGTCGELAQGVLPDGTAFVVTCPIDRGTTVEVSLSPASSLEIVGVPAGRERLAQALRRTAELLELSPHRVTVSHATELPVGKGMASSTADIVAASRALAAAAGMALAPEHLAALASSIEPSDGVMYDGIVAADRRTGALVRAWDWWPSFTVVAVVPPATFATADARLDTQRQHAEEYAALLARLDAAVVARDAAAFARVAARSAELGQSVVSNRVFVRLAARVDEFGALGVCAAHTGTVAGLLFPRTREGHSAAAAAARALRIDLPADVDVTVAHTPDRLGA